MLSSTAETYAILNSSINSFDLAFDHFIRGIRTIPMTSFFFILTNFADVLVVMFVMLVVVLLLRRYDYHRDVIPFVVCVAGSFFSSVLLKQLFHRERPSGALYFEPTYSFPSSHSTVALALYSFIAFLIVKYIKNKFISIPLAILSVCLALLVGVSRLYLGVHYLSDVIGGFLIALLWIVFSTKLSKAMNKQKTGSISDN